MAAAIARTSWKLRIGSQRWHGTHNPQPHFRALSIADLLDATVDEVIDFLAGFPDSRPAQRAVESLKLLQEVGLGYAARPADQHAVRR